MTMMQTYYSWMDLFPDGSVYFHEVPAVIQGEINRNVLDGNGNIILESPTFTAVIQQTCDVGPILIYAGYKIKLYQVDNDYRLAG